jgi:hypothetical protein
MNGIVVNNRTTNFTQLNGTLLDAQRNSLEINHQENYAQIYHLDAFVLGGSDAWENIPLTNNVILKNITHDVSNEKIQPKFDAHYLVTMRATFQNVDATNYLRAAMRFIIDGVGEVAGSYVCEYVPPSTIGDGFRTLTSTFIVQDWGSMTGFFQVAVEDHTNLSIANSPVIGGGSTPDYQNSAAINITHVSNV